MSETDLVKAVIELIELRGGVALRVNSGIRVIPGDQGGKDRVFRGAPAGTSDIVALYKGYYMAVECKIGKNVPTVAQEIFLERVVQAGGMAIVTRSVDFVDALLSTLAQVAYINGARFNDNIGTQKT